jgi:hypothetical protein
VVEFPLAGFFVRKEAVKQVRYFQRLAESEYSRFAAVLIENGDLRFLEDDIPGGGIRP